MAAVGRRHERRTPGAGVVAAALALDLDDVGAEVGENLPGPRTGQNAGKLQHAQPGERTRFGTWLRRTRHVHPVTPRGEPPRGV